jgi:hypothetical protein
LLFFQEACLTKLNRVKPPVNLGKLQKKEKKKRKKDRLKERKKENILTNITTPELFCLSFSRKKEIKKERKKVVFLALHHPR